MSSICVCWVDSLNAKLTQIDDIHKDYQRQRHYLERSVDSLNAKLTKDMKVHKKDHQRIMQENIALIKEINVLRREIKHTKTKQKLREEKTVTQRKKDSDIDGNGNREALEREMEAQQEQIRALKAQLKMFEEDDFMFGERPPSQPRLPPLQES